MFLLTIQQLKHHLTAGEILTHFESVKIADIKERGVVSFKQKCYSVYKK